VAESIRNVSYIVLRCIFKLSLRYLDSSYGSTGLIRVKTILLAKHRQIPELSMHDVITACMSSLKDGRIGMDDVWQYKAASCILRDPLAWGLELEAAVKNEASSAGIQGKPMKKKCYSGKPFYNHCLSNGNNAP
jgi:hypothetical protein